MSDFVERMRKSKTEAKGVRYEAGVKAGREWAEMDGGADYEQINRLVEGWDSFDPNDGWEASLAELISPDATADSFWEAALGEQEYAIVVNLPEALKKAFFFGFGVGAIQVWRANCVKIETEEQPV